MSSRNMSEGEREIVLAKISRSIDTIEYVCLFLGNNTFEPKLGGILVRYI